jgi:hypothetical protein
MRREAGRVTVEVVGVARNWQRTMDRLKEARQFRIRIQVTTSPLSLLCALQPISANQRLAAEQ